MRPLVYVQIASLVLLMGCASAPPLTDAGSQVREITADQAKECKFVKVVQYTDSQLWTVGKTPTVMAAIGDTNLRNAAAQAGANALVVTSNRRNTFMGSLNYQGEAYLCP